MEGKGKSKENVRAKLALRSLDAVRLDTSSCWLRLEPGWWAGQRGPESSTPPHFFLFKLDIHSSDITFIISGWTLLSPKILDRTYFLICFLAPRPSYRFWCVQLVELPFNDQSAKITSISINILISWGNVLTYDNNTNVGANAEVFHHRIIIIIIMYIIYLHNLAQSSSFKWLAASPTCCQTAPPTPLSQRAALTTNWHIPD